MALKTLTDGKFLVAVPYLRDEWDASSVAYYAFETDDPQEAIDMFKSWSTDPVFTGKTVRRYKLVDAVIAN